MALATSASGQLHFDVSLQQNESDARLSIHGRNLGLLPSDPNRIDLGRRVFGRSFEVQGNSLFQNDPGFTSSGSEAELDPFGLDAPAGGHDMCFAVLSPPPMLTELGGRNINYWNGSGPIT